MREICPFGFQFNADLNGLFDAQVRHMRCRPQSVEDQHIQVFQQFPTRTRDLTDIGTVGDVANPKPQYIEVGAVLEWDRDNGRARISCGSEPMRQMSTEGLAPAWVSGSSENA